jgi:hypothetical protein
MADASLLAAMIAQYKFGILKPEDVSLPAAAMQFL